MRYLGLDDIYKAASVVWAVEAEEAALTVRAERAHRALLPDRVSRSQTVTSEAARLFVALVESGAFPRAAYRCSWLCARRLLELNGLEPDETATQRSSLTELVAEHRRGEPVEGRLAVLLAGQFRPPRQGVRAGAHPRPTVRIYFTSRVSGLSEPQRHYVAELEWRIKELLHTIFQRCDLEFVGWAGALAGAELERYPRLLPPAEDRLFECDAMIVIGTGGGSFGAGDELAAALASLKPVLFLQPDREPLSRKLEETLRRAGVSIRRFARDDPARIERHVSSWLGEHMDEIVDAARRSELYRTRTARLFGALGDRANRLPPQEFRRRLAQLGFAPELASALLGDARHFGRASLVEVAALCAALDVPFVLDGHSEAMFAPPAVPTPAASGRRQERSPQLRPVELAALEEVARERRLTGTEVANLVRVAQSRITAEREDVGVTLARRSPWDKRRWAALCRELFG